MEEDDYFDDVIESHKLFVVREAETGIVGVEFMEVGGCEGVCCAVELFIMMLGYILNRYGDKKY